MKGIELMLACQHLSDLVVGLTHSYSWWFALTSLQIVYLYFIVILHSKLTLYYLI